MVRIPPLEGKGRQRRKRRRLPSYHPSPLFSFFGFLPYRTGQADNNKEKEEEEEEEEEEAEEGGISSSLPPFPHPVPSNMIEPRPSSPSPHYDGPA